MQRLERLESIIVEHNLQSAASKRDDEYEQERKQHVAMLAAKDRLQSEKAWRSWCRYMLTFMCFRKRYDRHA